MAVDRLTSKSIAKKKSGAAYPYLFEELEAAFAQYEAVIGIEVHCQLALETKLFSSAHCKSGGRPNEFIDTVTLALPGALPVLNEKAVDLAIRMGAAVGAQINPVSVFTRKNYFYPDLPKGYQITQFDRPICSGGSVILSTGRAVRIDRIQIEEDAGKSQHVGDHSLVDYNRAGRALIEIVSEPDIRTPFEASEYLRFLHRNAVFFGVSDGNLEEGNFRADANVSIRLRGSSALETRTEIKNLNSFRFVERAIALEVLRQIRCKESGEAIVLETRGYDSDYDRTFSQRSKEMAQDYRYFPEPDLPPLILASERIVANQEYCKEWPLAAQARLVRECSLGEQDALTITQTKELLGYFDQVKELLSNAPAKSAATFLTSLEKLESLIQSISPHWLASALDAVSSGKIALKTLKENMWQAWGANQPMLEWVVSQGLEQLDAQDALETLAKELLLEFPDQAQGLASGKDKLLAFFVGQAMKRTKGAVSPQVFSGILLDLFKKPLV